MIDTNIHNYLSLLRGGEMFRRYCAQILAIVAMMTVPTIAIARCQALPAPTGEVILTITGKIACTNAPGRADFDLKMLDNLPQTTLRTKTPWAVGVQKFTGIPLSQLLNIVQVQAASLSGVAHNDYHADIPVNDTSEDAVLVATRHNDEVMTLRTRGPVRIIYPDTTENPKSFERMIWQLRTLTAID